MAYRRSLTTSARLFTHQRFTPSISYVSHHEDRKSQHSDKRSNSFLQSRSYGVLRNNTNTLRIGAGSCGLPYQDPRWSHFTGATSGFLLARNMSTNIVGEAVNEVANVVSTQATPVLSEVAAAAADSCLPVAAMQHFMDAIHNFTGLNWWATIVITTVIVRGLQVPFSTFINTTERKFPSVELMTSEELKRIRRISTLGFLISLSLWLSYMFALANMVKYVPSFKTGGTSWFLDLTTTDDFFGLPFLVLLYLCCTPKYYFRKAKTKILTRMIVVTGAFVIAWFPIALFVPKAFLINFVTWNLFEVVLRVFPKLSIQKFLNILTNTKRTIGANIREKNAYNCGATFKKSTSSSSSSQKLTSEDQNMKSTSSSPLSYKSISKDQKSS